MHPPFIIIYIQRNAIHAITSNISTTTRANRLFVHINLKDNEKCGKRVFTRHPHRQQQTSDLPTNMDKFSDDRYRRSYDRHCKKQCKHCVLSDRSKHGSCKSHKRSYSSSDLSHYLFLLILFMQIPIGIYTITLRIAPQLGSW